MKMANGTVAALGAIHRTIPTTWASLATASAATQSTANALLPYVGKWIWLYATTLDITIALGSRAVVAGQGLVLKTTDAPMELFVDPGVTADISFISTGTATLNVLFD